MQGGVGGKGGPMTFGRSKAKLLDGGHVKTNFSDVAGCEEAKDDVKEQIYQQRLDDANYYADEYKAKIQDIFHSTFGV